MQLASRMHSTGHTLATAYSEPKRPLKIFFTRRIKETRFDLFAFDLRKLFGRRNASR